MAPKIRDSDDFTGVHAKTNIDLQRFSGHIEEKFHST